MPGEGGVDGGDSLAWASSRASEGMSSRRGSDIAEYVVWCVGEVRSCPFEGIPKRLKTVGISRFGLSIVKNYRTKRVYVL